MEIPDPAFTMARALLLWSLLSVVNIVLVTTSGQCQEIPENYLKQTGKDSQLVSIQFEICRPCQPEGQTGQSEGQGLPVMINSCSLQINKTITRLFFTNKTSDDSCDGDDSYLTLLEVSAVDKFIKLLAKSKPSQVTQIQLTGAFIFDLQCKTEGAEISPEAKPSFTSPFKGAEVKTPPSIDDILADKYWIIIVVILALTNLVQAVCLFYKCRRYRFEVDRIPTTYCRQTKSRKTDKEDWQLNPQNDNEDESLRFQSTEQINTKTKSWHKKKKSKTNQHKKHNNVNTENNETMNQEAGRDMFPVPINSHDHPLSKENVDEDYLPMDNHQKKSKTDQHKKHTYVNTENSKTMNQEAGRELFHVPIYSHDHPLSKENVDEDYLPMDNHRKKSEC
ncbi:uncharacterized protein LOC110456418 isoform X2 [Mizuhopecten yessoensis]|uniref:Uncharacterized protein n=1 Tax=Mizuhopecten yessoensis TaxID=6573 RepID=A0A210QAZ2_MIZYE|nr:uncharacterized protein LOC110456418 isoform X2 [Mizuhopecten yessoensis]OWF45885.1 hypothetical protein KP79_PYT07281 [Mizuhopecten yessoensis]